MELTHAQHEKRTSILLGLSSDDVEARRQSIGASDANIILGKNEESILKLWRFKTGQEPAEDLTDVLPVQMGVWTEDFNIFWYEKQTGDRVTSRKQKVTSEIYPWLTCTLDGMCSSGNSVFEAKHVGPFNYNLDSVVARYLPQLTVQMTLCEVDAATISVLSGNSKWESKTVALDPLYQAQVISACRKFWEHCQNGTPPCDLPDVEAQLPVKLMRTLDLRLNNEWCSWEQEYLTHEAAAKRHEAAEKELRALVPNDVGEAQGKFVTLKRDSRGALRIKKTKG